MSVEKTHEKRETVSVGSGAMVRLRGLRLSANERRLLRSAIASAIQNQTELIHANHEKYSGKPCIGSEKYVKEWLAEIRAWQALSIKLSMPNIGGETQPPKN